jgi:hypothetical protein
LLRAAGADSELLKSLPVDIVDILENQWLLLPTVLEP